MLIDTKAKLVPNENKAKANEIYYFQIPIGSLLFLALACRSNINFIVIKLARFALNLS